jgi:predicted RND superfamily exporter protein
MNKFNLTEFMEKNAAGIARRPWRALLVALILTGLAGIGVASIPFITSRKAMLPKQADVTVRLERFLTTFGAASDLIVVLDGAPRRAMEKFAADLAEDLRELQTVRQVSERVDLTFFFKHAYLLVPPKQMRQFASVLQRLIGVPPQKELADWDDAFLRVERWLGNPPPLSTIEVDLQTAEGGLRMIQFFAEEWQRWLEERKVPEEIAWQRFLTQYGAGELAVGKGHYASRDGRMLFVFVSPRDTTEEYEAVDPFIRQVRKTIRELRGRYQVDGLPTPRAGLTGLPAVTHEEFTTVQRDILLIVCTAAVFILLLIGLWFRSLRWALVVFIPMGLGVFWNIGLTYLIVGHLTMLTSGFTAILFGLGVDYGIFLSSRIFEERRRDRDLVEAISRGVASCTKALITAGGATVLIFAVLGTMPFSGFAEFGLVAACGVLLVLASTFLVQPAMFALLPPSIGRARRLMHTARLRCNSTARAVLRKPSRAAKISGVGSTTDESSAHEGLKFSRPISALLVGAALVAAVSGVVGGFSIPFDYDVLSLLPRKSEAAYYQRRMVAESDYQAETLIFTAPSMREARRIAKAAEKLETISQVQTITDLFPNNGAERVRQGRQIGAIAAGSAYLRQIMALGDVKLKETTMERIRSSLEKTETLLEDSEEMAFSAGHKHLVVLFEAIHSRLEDLREKLEKDPEHARVRTERFVQAILSAARLGFEVLFSWQQARILTPEDLPSELKDRFIADDGTVAVYVHAAKSVYVPENLDKLIEDVYRVSSEVTGFPTTHQVFSRMAVFSFKLGTLLAILIAMAWILAILRNVQGFIIALLPLLVGGGWMLLVMSATDMKFNYANIIALPLVIGLAVDYGVWFAYRRRELPDVSPWRVAVIAGRAILLAAGTTLAGLGAIILAEYRGVASMGIAISIGLACCVVAALLISPAITQFLFGRKS